MRPTSVIAIASAGSLIAASVVVGIGAAGADADLSNIGAWLPSSVNGGMVHVNGLSGDVDGRVRVERSSESSYQVSEDGETVLVVDQSNGQVSRIDPAQLTVPQTVETGVAGLQLLTGGGKAWLVDAGAAPEATSGFVRPIDPVTLNPLGAPLDLQGKPLGRAQADSKGTLWVPIPSKGQVVPVNGATLGNPLQVTEPGGAMVLTLASDRPVVIDVAAGAVKILSDKGVDSTVSLPSELTKGDIAKLKVPGTSEGTVVPVLAGDSGALALVDIESGSVSTVQLRTGNHELGDPEVLGAKVYVADRTSGALLVYDVEASKLESPVKVTGVAGPLETFVRDGLLWVNDQRNVTAAVVDTKGNLHKVQKYDQKGGDPVPGDDPPATTTPPTVPPDDRQRPDAPGASAPPEEESPDEGSGDTDNGDTDTDTDKGNNDKGNNDKGDNRSDDGPDETGAPPRTRPSQDEDSDSEPGPDKPVPTATVTVTAPPPSVPTPSATATATVTPTASKTPKPPVSETPTPDPSTPEPSATETETIPSATPTPTASETVSPTPPASSSTPPPPTKTPEPTAPGNPKATSHDGYITVTFSPSAEATPISYRLDGLKDGMKAEPASLGPKGSREFKVTGGSCREYSFKVVAVYPNVEKRSASATAFSCVKPGAPTGYSATPTAKGGHGGKLKWVAPKSKGGATVTYVVKIGGKTHKPKATSLTVTKLKNSQTYKAVLTAVNGAGSSRALTETLDLRPKGRTYKVGPNEKNSIDIGIRSGPGVKGTVRNGAIQENYTGNITVFCQTKGEKATRPGTSVSGSIWDKVKYTGPGKNVSGWTSDLFIRTPNSGKGKFSSEIWQCD